MFTGTYTAIVTPFKNGKLDETALAHLVKSQVKGGVDGIVPVGTTGESPTVDNDEHIRIVELSVKQAAGRIKVMAGTGSNSTEEALELTRWAAKAGADAVLIVAPYYNKPTGEGFYQHYRAVAEAVDIPIILYNIPGRTAKNIEPDVVARIAEIPNVVAIKEATGSMDQASQTLALTNLTVLSGDDSLTLPILAMGGSGIVSVVGNIVPGDMLHLLKAFKAGNIAEAQKWHFKLFSLCRDMLGIATNPIPVKIAMKMLGRDTGELRLPLTPLSPAEEERLRKTLVAYGLL